MFLALSGSGIYESVSVLLYTYVVDHDGVGCVWVGHWQEMGL